MRLVKFLLLTLGVFVFAVANAKKIEGYIVLRNNEKLSVTLIIPAGLLSQEPKYERIQSKIKYIDGDKKTVSIRPDEVKEFSFNWNGEQVRMVSVFDNLDLGSIFSSQVNIFLRLQIDGKLRLFNYYYTQQSPGVYNGSTGAMTGGYSYGAEKYILQKDGKLFWPRGISFKKDMAAYFADCELISQKIKDKEFRKGDMELIVQEYNKQCGN